MKWFIDTEFYEEGGDGVMRIEWISIGMCNVDRSIEFYAENDDFDWSRVPSDHWLQENVRPHLEQSKFPDIAMSSREVAECIEDMVGPKPEFYGWFCDYDWVVLCSMFGRMVDLPDHFPRFCRDLKQTTKELHIDKSDLPRQDDEEHHALNDAQWNADVYVYTKQVEERLRETGVLPFLPDDAGQSLAGNVKSFLGSAPFCAPENFPFLIEEKLTKPLAQYEEAVQGD